MSFHIHADTDDGAEIGDRIDFAAQVVRAIEMTGALTLQVERRGAAACYPKFHTLPSVPLVNQLLPSLLPAHERPLEFKLAPADKFGNKFCGRKVIDFAGASPPAPSCPGSSPRYGQRAKALPPDRA